jgi:hypothetical protein
MCAIYTEVALQDQTVSEIRDSKCETRGTRKVTTGITGLWQPGVHSDVAF